MAPPCRLFEHKTDKIFKEEPINRKQGANRYERIKTLVPVQRIFGLRNDGTRLVKIGRFVEEELCLCLRNRVPQIT
jgi:hypothetical protein